LVKITRPQGFVTNSGYTDYFKPFCGEVSGLLLQFLNRSPLPYSGKLPFIKGLAAAWLRVATRPQTDYFAFEKIKSAEVVAAPLFDVGMSWALKRRSLMRALWEYNDQTSEEVDAIKARISLPPQYLSMCIRRGDKSIEFQYVALERYQEAVASVDLGLRTIFLTTDDFDVVRNVVDVFSGFDVITLTERSSKGYVHSEFKSLSSKERRYQTLRFFAQFEYLRNGELVIVSKTTNVSHITNVFRGGEGMIWVD
jgi:hypothetical protein